LRSSGNGSLQASWLGAADAPNAKSGTSDFNGSILVTHAHNVYLSMNAIEKAGPISIDTTSTDGVRH
jgi:hypothetical protein